MLTWRDEEEGWYPQGVMPEPGKTYEWEGFFGGRFVATFERYETVSDPGARGCGCEALIAEDGPNYGLRLSFANRCPLETNLPIRFRDAKEE